MKKEFITYELALRLKVLGFDEPCLKVGNPNGVILWRFMDVAGVEGVGISTILAVEFDDRWVEIPTFSQCFKWFREKHNLNSWVTKEHKYKKPFCWYIQDNYSKYDSDFMEDGIRYNTYFQTYEDAELECLTALIEIVEQKIKN